MQEKKSIVVAVSGGFDPIHPGHIRYFREAKKLGDQLLVILNNDNWVMAKKSYIFMSEKERKEVIEALRDVDRVVITKHIKNTTDMGVSTALKELKPDVFAKGGDRNEKDAQNPRSSLYEDILTCKKLGIKIVYNVGRGGKIQSSSELVNKAAKSAPRKINVKIKK
ncbi:MAG: adenylyltransferase/cytidyltransferase family protein [bacterium]|nr:adenylyltransferase/cytidyltransferase family protein [bacterium]